MKFQASIDGHFLAKRCEGIKALSQAGADRLHRMSVNELMDALVTAQAMRVLSENHQHMICRIDPPSARLCLVSLRCVRIGPR
jgi:hypothetical protein